MVVRHENAWGRPGGSDLVLGQEPAAGRGRNVERLEDAIADADHTDLFRFGHPRHGRPGRDPHAQRLKGPVLLGVGEIHGWGETQPIGRTQSRSARRDLPERHQFLCPRIRQRLEQDAIEDAEDRGVRANAERESQHDDHREREVVAHGAKGVPNVLPERVNDGNRELIAIRVLDLSQSTHRAASRGTGVVRGQSLRACFSLERIKVVRQLRRPSRYRAGAGGTRR